MRRAVFVRCVCVLILPSLPFLTINFFRPNSVLDTVASF